jgi:predicted nucleic-acid-binding Zn-ribbon protein
MEKTLQCPKCGSTEIEVRDHNKLLKTTGGVLMTALELLLEQWVELQQVHQLVPRLVL